LSDFQGEFRKTVSQLAAVVICVTAKHPRCSRPGQSHLGIDPPGGLTANAGV